MRIIYNLVSRKNCNVVIISVFIFCLLLGCKRDSSANIRQSSVEGKILLQDMLGKKMDVLITKFGLPDGIYPRSNFQVVWEGPEATVALLYLKDKQRVFLSSDCTVVCVSPIVK
jgi:hypothetical protein